MSSHVDRERDRSKITKSVRKWETDFRRKHHRPPTQAETQTVRDAITAAVNGGPGTRVALPTTPVALTPQQSPKAVLADRLIRNEHVELGPINIRATPQGLEFDSDADRDAVGADARYIWHTAQFQAAKTHAEQLKHALGALMATLQDKVGRFGPAEILIRDAALVAIIVGIEDQLAGRDSLLLRKVALPVRPAVEGTATSPTPQWIASAFIVALGKAVERFDTKKTKKPALRKVITDLEAHGQLGEKLDNYFPEGNGTGINKGQEKRIDDLVSRFGERHFAKLSKGQAPHVAIWVYQLLTSEFAATAPDMLAKAYPLWLNIARQYIQQAKVRPDTWGGQKAGSRRDQAREKIDFSTGD